MSDYKYVIDKNEKILFSGDVLSCIEFSYKNKDAYAIRDIEFKKNIIELRAELINKSLPFHTYELEQVYDGYMIRQNTKSEPRSAWLHSIHRDGTYSFYTDFTYAKHMSMKTAQKYIRLLTEKEQNEE